MGDESASRAPGSFWAIGAIALIWNVLGVLNYFRQMDADVVAEAPEFLREIIERRPAWATGAFAIAVFGGALGCVLLLLRKSAASYLFTVSLLAVIGQMIPLLGLVGSIIDGPFEITMIVLPLVVAGFLLWYSTRAKSKGWIG